MALSQEWNLDPLLPVFPDEAIEIPIKLPASVTYVKGQVLGEMKGTNEVQKLVITGGPTGGSFTMTFGAQTTAAIAYNASPAEIQSALEALSTIGDGNVRVYGGVLPGGSVFIEFRGSLGGANQAQLTTTDSLTGGTSPATAVTTVTAGAAATPGSFKAYDNDNTDGSQEARLILKYSVVVDSDGLITLGTAEASNAGEKHRTVPAYRRGTFRTTQLTSLTEDAVAQLGRIIQGNLADGLLQMS